MTLVGLFVPLGILCLAVSVPAKEVVSCKSPDGRFAMRCVYAEKQPYNGEAAIVDLATHKTILVLDPNWTLCHARLLWSPDSQRVAYFFRKGTDYSTRIFFQKGDALNEMAFPELPRPKLPKNATGSEPNTSTRVEPMKWNGPNELFLEKELISPDWGRGALKITLGFDQNSSPSIRKAEQEKVSVIDYFLLLPAKNFEAPPSTWLRGMRGHDRFFPCESEPEDNVDEENGYMGGGGGGAQSSFNVALFRYRNGRPLLALCHAGEPEVEEENSVYSYLSFFELGADGKMHEITRWMFQGVTKREHDAELARGKEWDFVLPRKGRTILVRAPNTKKILHKFTWDGEKFVEQK